MISALVFITNGPRCTTGSPIGRLQRKRSTRSINIRRSACGCSRRTHLPLQHQQLNLGISVVVDDRCRCVGPQRQVLLALHALAIDSDCRSVVQEHAPIRLAADCGRRQPDARTRRQLDVPHGDVVTCVGGPRVGRWQTRRLGVVERAREHADFGAISLIDLGAKERLETNAHTTPHIQCEDFQPSA
jgi:hypothetical protein